MFGRILAVGAFCAGSLVPGLVAAGPGATAPAPATGHHRGFDEPYTGFAPPSTRLRPARPKEAGLNTAEIDTMLEELRGFLTAGEGARPLFPGVVVLAAHDGKVFVRDAMGHALRYADKAGTELPPEQQVAMTEDTIFDMASVSKLFTSIVVMQQVERGRIDLGATVASYLPEFAANGKERITVQQLMTHTSGLPSWMRLWRPYPDKPARIAAVMNVTPQAPPDTRYTYSDLNLITLGALVEKVSGEPLDALVRKGITEPLGMHDTGYNPPASKHHRVAATEFESDPDRGMVRGSVHDENAWSLGGVAGHAGIFSTADDMARLCQAILDGGIYDGARILGETATEQMLTDYNQAFPGHAHGLGFDLNQRFYMGALSSPRTAGHTGFTGTSVVIDPLSRSFVVLLSNRVHPDRAWSGVNTARRVVAQRIAQALDVSPRHGRMAWFSGTRDGETATLTAPVALRGGETRLAFDMFVDSENTDILTLELSSDDGSTWTPVPFVMWSRGRLSRYDDGQIFGFTGRHWQHGFAELDASAGDALLRWRYVTDPAQQGRGIYLDGVLLVDRSGVLLDGERQPERFVPVGWRLASR